MNTAVIKLKSLWLKVPLVSQQIILGTAFLNIVILVWSMTINVDMLFTLAIMVWLNCMAFSVMKIRERFFLFLYLWAFFVFLLGREALQQFLEFRVEDFSQETQKHSHLSLLIALGTIWIISVIVSFVKVKLKVFFKPRTGKVNSISLTQSTVFMKAVILVYALILLCSVVYRVIVITYVFQNTYYGYHKDFSVLMNENMLIFFLAKVEYMLTGAFCFVLALSPTRKILISTVVSFLLYALMTLAGGQRFPFVAAVSIIITYFVLRNKDVMLSKKQKKIAIAFLGVLVVSFLLLFYIMEYLRGTNVAVQANPFISLLYTQGVSFNVIRRGFAYISKIPTGKFYSISFLFSGIPAILSGTTVYQGHNIANALNGHSYSHAVSYAIYAEGYLQGVSYGSSYIAEAYHDFGYVGIFVWSFIFAIIMSWVSSLDGDRIYRNVVKLLCVPAILWAPRGEASGFLTTLIAPSNLLLYAGIGVLAWLATRYERRQLLTRAD